MVVHQEVHVNQARTPQFCRLQFGGSLPSDWAVFDEGPLNGIRTRNGYPVEGRAHTRSRVGRVLPISPSAGGKKEPPGDPTLGGSAIAKGAGLSNSIRNAMRPSSCATPALPHPHVQQQ